MPRIFISYRRGDSIGHTGRLFDLLSKHFGSGQVFMDIDTIGPGENYVDVIQKTCASCEVLLAVIGRGWLNAADENGNRRLDDPGDFVRMEIAHVLAKGIRVVPVLVDGAKMPDGKSLPPDLKQLALRNAWEINDKNFHHDVGQLIEGLQKMQPSLQPFPSPPGAGQARRPTSGVSAGGPTTADQPIPLTRRNIYIGVGGVAVLMLLLVISFEWFRSTINMGQPASNSAPAGSGGPYDIQSLQAKVTAPLLFFLADPRYPVPPIGQRSYATVFQSAQTSTQRIFWEVALNFQGQFPPKDYQIESIWYCDSKEVYRGMGNFKGSDVATRAFHNRFGWDPPQGRLPAGQYRVDLLVGGQKITSGNFTVQQ